MKKLYLFIILALPILLKGQPSKLLTPEEFLGYKLGERFSPHYKVLAYFNHVAAVVPNVSLHLYGETYEHRPLVYAVITSPDNFKDIEAIRLHNLRRTGMQEGKASTDKKAIVWLSYNVHGNEASSLEASMMTLYELVSGNNAKVQAWLKNTVVIIDPCLNPDGRDRYANFYHQYGNVEPNPSTDAKEHYEPWPGGRFNHYLFDLNRDWAWLTQKESEQRLKVYHQWMPHVHVDFHEQGYNSPYYFAPAAEPFHEVVTPWQRTFQTRIGKNNAKYFDAHGWLYFTKEVFDLYYPSYGDTYPTYNGAIGMTYEQGGGGFGGLSVTTKEGDLLTLKDRILHHHVSGLSTIEITSQHANQVVDAFEKYFHENIHNPQARYKTYVIKADNNSDKLAKLTKWLTSHSIIFGHPSSNKATKAFDFQTQTVSNVTITTDDIIVNVNQPKSRFITTVFEPQSHLPDSLTYDITAWNLMYAYGLKAYALNERLAVNKPYTPKTFGNATLSRDAYAYICRYRSLEDVAFLAALLQQGIKVRSAEKSFVINKETFEPGTLILTRRNNETTVAFDSVVQSMAKAMGRELNVVTTGFVDAGKDIGSADVNFLKMPRVAMLFGDQTHPPAAGEVWHFFEQQIHYPITQLGTAYFKTVSLKNYDVLIIPEGNYNILDESTLEIISDWTSEGGKLIVMGSALSSFVDKKGFALKIYTTPLEKEESDRLDISGQEKNVLIRYDEAERKNISDAISGAIFSIRLDNSHPLAFGLSDTYFTLKTSETRYGFLEKGWNVGVIKDKAKPIQGFAGYIANSKINNSLVFGVEEKGRGNVIYMVDNPLFRSFWESGKMIFANAIFMVGQ